MKKKPDIFIASGTTRVWLDDVRFITNDSAGTTGALIGEEFLEDGYDLYYLGDKKTLKPYDKKLIVNRDADIEKELLRIKKELENYQENIKGKIEFFTALDFYEYHKKIIEILDNRNIKIAILPVAGSDFGVKKVDGKIKSNENINLEFEILPKMISDIKKIRKDIFLVGFKLLKDSSPEQLIEIAYKSMLRDHQDITVANISKGGKGFGDFLTYLITIEKGIIPVKKRNDLQKILKNTIENRYSENYYKTKFTKVEKLPVEDNELKHFMINIQELSKLALFSKYLEGKREEFGFVAKRTELGTLITSRGSSKSEACEKDLALITDIDKDRVIKVQSVDKKASLNGNIAHHIFEKRLEINYIVHSHIKLVNGVKANRETSPGTQEDWDSVKKLVESGEKIIYQQNHGVLILLNNLSELIPLLEKNNIYNHNADLYDIAYKRFQKNTRFVDIVDEELKKDGDILDMCAGTGEVSLQLLEKGFKNITAQDASKAMLQQSVVKIPDLQTKIGSFEEFHEKLKYDGIVIRQAINYIKPLDLNSIFNNLRNGLKDEGKLIFNTFLISNETQITKKNKDEIGDKIIITEEGNLIIDNLVHHGQKTQIFDKKTGDYDEVYDLNSFYSYSENDFMKNLKEVGFSNIKIIKEKRSLYFICSK